MKCVRAVVLALVFFAPAVTQAAPLLPGAPDTLPLLYVCANDECLDLSGAINRLPGEKVTFGVEVGAIFAGAGQVAINALYNPDPFIAFSVTTTNAIAGPIKYSFLFGTFIVPGDYGFATTTNANLSVTNGVGTATVDNSNDYPTYISGYGTDDFLATNLGVDLGSGPCSAGPGPPSTTPCPLGSTSNTFATTFFNNLEALVTYSQLGFGSVASVTGRVDLLEEDPDPGPDPIPEPTHLVLYGLVALGYRLKTRMRR